VVNYRHAFHAGSFADVFKHAVLCRILHHLREKPAPFRVIDTHAGAGLYELTSDEAMRTGEWHDGIERLRAAQLPAAVSELLKPYLDVIDALNERGKLTVYPGSPALVRALLRPVDRLACCELQPDDAAALKRLFRHDRQAAVHRRDGWEALGALLPPAERRGLILIDPPFEQPDELAALVEGLRAGYRRFRPGVFAAWYPVKHRAPVRLFHTALRESGMRDIICAELLLRAPLDPVRLNGCGLAVVNPPFGFEAAASAILEALLHRLGNRESGEGISLGRLVDE
jgi:23S rRNA (adenine2030-N6)-methyltransferase